MGQRDMALRIRNMLRLRNQLLREFLAEFLGMFVLISFGTGATAQVILGHGHYGDFLSINLAWGWAVAMAVWVCGGVSGGHLNPAITVAVAVLGGIKWVKVPVYCLAQYLGTFAASACVYGIYYDALNNHDGGNRTIIGETATANIWSSYPQPFVSTLSGFGDQVFGTMMLVLCIMAITDKFNMGIDPRLTPMAVGGVITVIGLSYGLNTGYSINPARDFAARAFTACAGWGVEVFTVYDYWFWVPLVAPHVGAVCGALFYLVLVGLHTEPEVTPPIVESLDKKENHDDFNRF